MTARKDPRIVFLNQFVIRKVNRRWFRDDGGYKYCYCYVWYHGNIAIYVGEGQRRRYKESWRGSMNPNSPYMPNRDDMHSYFVNYWEELEIIFAVHGTTKTAALAVQDGLIDYFRANQPDGTLFNKRGNELYPWPPEDAEDLFNARHRASFATNKPSDHGWCDLLKNLPEQLDEGANGAWLRPCPPSRKS